MKSEIFFGRENELRLLKEFMSHPNSSFLAVTGRRRIGKSRLIREFAKSYRYLVFEGLAPEEGIDGASQKREFGRQLNEYFDYPPSENPDWADLFNALGHYLDDSKTVILFDEISWMALDDPTFLPKLKIFWDRVLNLRNNVVFIICSSISSWIDENVLSSTGFVGRVHHVLEIDPLPLNVCNQFFDRASAEISAFQKFQVISVTGGVPLYLERFDFDKSLDQNLRMICFSKGGLLYREFEQIFVDLFSKRSDLYKEIVECLVHGPLDNLTLCKKIGIQSSQRTSAHFKHLVKAGFIKRDFTWDIKKGNFSKLSVYRLSDNYLRFYLRYIEPNKEKIEQESMKPESLLSLNQINIIFALQFENLVLQNIPLLIKQLNIPEADIEIYGAYFQTKTNRTPGCQIDCLIQTRHNDLYVCEIKFSKRQVGMEVISEMDKKLKAFVRPKGFSVRTVLIHVNGITEPLEDEHYFSQIIDFAELLDD